MDPRPHPVLYSFRRCPYAMRARLALLVSGQRCALREVVLRDKPAHFLSVSPKATVPVLWLPDGTVIDESMDVMHWALRQADPEGWLEADPVERDALIEVNDGPFKHHLDRYKYANRFEGAEAEAHRSQAEESLKTLEERLTAQSYLMGDLSSMADIALAPFVRQFANTDRAWFESAPYPGLRRWLDAFIESAGFQAIMVKYDPWVPESDVVWFGGDATS